MKKHLSRLFSSWAMYCTLLTFSTVFCSATVILRLNGQFGNQLFQIATAVALAKENNCDLYFPDFDHVNAAHLQPREIDKNYHALFYRISNRVAFANPTSIYYEPEFAYQPIPYQPDMEICGYFESEKYFGKYRDLLLELFAPPQNIEEDLKKDFSSLIEHPNTVGLHVRTFYRDFINCNSDYGFYNAFQPPDMEYYKQAIDLFDRNSLFVVFSDHINWCKKQFKGIDRNILFIEGQDHLHDFYLLSKCKNIIVGSSTFSWWAAYLNQNPSKKIICRKPFLHRQTQYEPKDILCEGWIPIYMPNSAPAPLFGE